MTKAKKTSTTKKAAQKPPQAPKKAASKAPKAAPGTLAPHGKENVKPRYAGRTQPLRTMLAQKRPVNNLRFPSAALGENPDNLYSLYMPVKGDPRRRVNTDGAIQGATRGPTSRGAMTQVGGVKSMSSIGKYVGASS
jgi:hypothetical protein